MSRRSRSGEGETARASVHDEARHLALELAAGRPSAPINLMRIGLVLTANETAYRYLPAAVSQFDPITRLWPLPTRVDTLVTDQRLLICLPSFATASLWWQGVSALRLDLAHDRLTLDFGDCEPRIFTGPAIPLIAVAAIGMTHGLTGLIDHPDLAPLRNSRR